MDKFFYTGSLSNVALNEAQDVTGTFGRLGIDLKTEVKAWDYSTDTASIVRGKLVTKPRIKYVSEEAVARLSAIRSPDATKRNSKFKKINAWFSGPLELRLGLEFK